MRCEHQLPLDTAECFPIPQQSEDEALVRDEPAKLYYAQTNEGSFEEWAADGELLGGHAARGPHSAPREARSLHD